MATGPIVVLWDDVAQAAVAYHRDLEGTPLNLIVENGRFTDAGTGSGWSLEGLAIDGALVGSRLRPVDEAFVAFWFAWKAFQPDTEIWIEVP